MCTIPGDGVSSSSCESENIANYCESPMGSLLYRTLTTSPFSTDAISLGIPPTPDYLLRKTSNVTWSNMLETVCRDAKKQPTNPLRRMVGQVRKWFRRSFGRRDNQHREQQFP